jgi:hypothetical protein
MKDKNSDDLLKDLALLDALIYTVENTTPIKDFIEFMVKKYRENLTKTFDDYKSDYVKIDEQDVVDDK